MSTQPTAGLAEANHTDAKQLQRRLDKVFQKLDRFLDEYDDQADE